VALGTTVVRALEHAAAELDGLAPGPGLATQRIGADRRLRMVDAIVTGVHQRGESHYELMRAFASDYLLDRVSTDLERHGYRSHEFGDSVLLVRRARRNHHPDRELRAADLCGRPRGVGRGLVSVGGPCVVHSGAQVRNGQPISKPGNLWEASGAPPYKLSNARAFPLVRGTFFEAR
jgi:Queuosine biosynthesis protein